MTITDSLSYASDSLSWDVSLEYIAKLLVARLYQTYCRWFGPRSGQTKCHFVGPYLGSNCLQLIGYQCFYLRHKFGLS